MNWIKIQLTLLCLVVSLSIAFTQVNTISEKSFWMTDAGQSCRIPYDSNHNLNSINSLVKRAVIFIHGTDRAAPQRYDDLYTAFSSTSFTPDTLAIITPQFLTEEDRTAHNLDNTCLAWTNNWDGWKYGYKSKASTAAISSYDVLDKLVEKVILQFPNLTHLVISGHSAGGQLVNRYAAFTPIEDLYIFTKIMFMPANPGTYLYLDDRRPDPSNPSNFIPVTDCPNYDRYKYGLSSLNNCGYVMNASPENVACRYGTRTVVYLVGENDNNPNHSGIDNSNCKEALQGNHRLERGINYYNYLKDYYGHQITARHFQDIIPNVGHSTAQLVASQQGRFRLFLWDGNQANEGDCACVNQLMISQPILENSLYKADYKIESMSQLSTNRDVVFKAGNSIELHANFEVPVGTTFEASIQYCSN